MTYRKKTIIITEINTFIFKFVTKQKIQPSLGNYTMNSYIFSTKLYKEISFYDI